MVRIVDRRLDSKNKSAVNRQRFMRRFKNQIRRAVSDAIAGRSIKDLDNGESVSIPAKDLAEPQFHHGRGGIWETIYTGNDQFSSGDQINRPQGGGGGGTGKGKASNEGEGEDDFVFNLSREEFLDVFFDDLALPNLVKTQLARIHEGRMAPRLLAHHADGLQPVHQVLHLADAIGQPVLAHAVPQAHRQALTKNPNYLVPAGDVDKLVAYLLSIDGDKAPLPTPPPGPQGGDFCQP